MRYLVLGLAIVFALVPFLTPFDGFDPEAFPVPQEDPPIQPAGWAFAIWGPIYLALIAHGARQVLRPKLEDRTIRPPLILSLGVGSVWLPIAQVSPVWATILITLMLGGALSALLVGRAARDPWLTDLPLGLYAGWLSAATGVSLALLCAGYGFVFDASGWGYVFLVIVIGLAAMYQLGLGFVPGYATAVAWALLGVIATNMDGSRGMVALATLGIVLIAGVLIATRGRKTA
ncbi:hypothetical protein [Pontivivens ytuae]|uniref:Uncharacterized protein n=1 Tax=Pontivivens ytuae TaxID=2789856 RepID=A0A7S9QDP2_9RHOB|nr:hypothetical protein [Pontivivens ytuae]QPH54351.1 hypothetical protein I0K15_00795 [Pontivivens ytuae]